ncbi:hypothetical protein Rhal01_02199 [Rubritalea halochordaticola]|uniref:Uncharacterized protein n=1 Tax=Rubritalea halochordaticola TaxID=714537 RepID=A0ABP9V0I5_9BACT
MDKWIANRFADKIPRGSGKKSARLLHSENRSRIIVANILAGLGILFGIVLYILGVFPDHDWRGAGVGMGLMGLLPLLWMLVSTISQGKQRVRECFTAYAISQKAPPFLLYPVMGLFSAIGFIAIALTI